MLVCIQSSLDRAMGLGQNGAHWPNATLRYDTKLSAVATSTQECMELDSIRQGDIFKPF